MPHLETVSLGVWVVVRRAPRERPPSTASRTCSSTWPSRARKRRSARAIAEEIEQVGGELNAATSLETTAYYARVLKGDEAVALEILADILQNSQLSPPRSSSASAR